MPLTKKQRQILDAIAYLTARGDSPTVREVGVLVGLSSSATVFKHLRALEAEKIITISGKSRGIRIADPDRFDSILRDKEGFSDTEGFRDTGRPPAYFRRLPGQSVLAKIPVTGAIAAGRPIEMKEEAFTSSATLDEVPSALSIDPSLFATSGEIIALRIEGDSMINAGILDGDYAIIRRQENIEEGEIAAVLINREATLKRWHYSGPHQSRETVRLEAANERFEPLEITEEDRKEVLIIGKYVGLVRGAKIF